MVAYETPRWLQLMATAIAAAWWRSEHKARMRPNWGCLGNLSADPLQDLGLSRSDLPALKNASIAADLTRRQR